MENATVFFFVVLGALAVDVLAGLTWWPDYFRIGIPLFIRRQPFSQAIPVLPGSQALADRFTSAWVVPILFKRLSSTEIAVRESFWGGFFRFTYTPLVHGLLEADPVAREIRIVGRVNAFPLAFLICFAVPFSIRTSADDPFLVPFLIGLFAFLFLIQFVRYGNVLFEARRVMESIHDHA